MIQSQTLRKVFVVLVAALPFMGAGIVLGGSVFLANSSWKASRERAKLELTHWAKISEDLRQLEAEPIWKNTRRRNAIQFIKKHVGMEFASADAGDLPEEATSKAQRFFARPEFKDAGSAQVTERLVRLRDLYSATVADLKTPEEIGPALQKLDLGQLDLSWVDQIQNYDHVSLWDEVWMPELLEELKKSSAFEQIELLSLMPSPQFGGLVHAAVLRALARMKLHGSRHLEEDLRNFEFIAQVSGQSESLVGQMVSVWALKWADRIEAYGRSRGWAVKRSPKSAASLKAFSRAAWIWTPAMHWVWTGEITEEQQQQLVRASVVAGGCSSLSEATISLMVFIGQGQWPLELDLREATARAQNFYRSIAAACVNSEAPQASASRAHEEAWRQALLSPRSINFLDFNWHEAALGVPYLRRNISLAIYDIGAASLKRDYTQADSGADPEADFDLEP
ncbi:MAG TPA: hypothetical protein PLZ57_03160 [Pseudobdellovibrionaceae bacterium]|mgnify:CR=1 FL=1|nr:hypothetical protein [Pseudobdellovibrionaceae bacterium]